LKKSIKRINTEKITSKAKPDISYKVSGSGKIEVFS